MKYSHLVIDYANPTNLDDIVTIEYALLHHTIVSRWVTEVNLATQTYQIDNPTRFYGFCDLESEVTAALFAINNNITVINEYSPVVTRTLLSVHDQDTLNYLHSIFEKYHGLLDQQDNDFWHAAPYEVRQALSNLNVNVHKCESISRGNQSRQVTTWYGLPKIQTLTQQDYELFTNQYVEGTVYLNYVEIGKTFENLSVDHDNYISNNAFRPFNYFSADFTVKFHSVSDSEVAMQYNKMLQYYLANQRFFAKLGYDMSSPEMQPGSIPLASTNQNVAELIKNHLYVKKVRFR